MKKLDAQEALVHLMVIVSASDRQMADPELARIGAIVRTLPVFRGFEHGRILAVAQECQQWLQRENGFAEMMAAIRDALPERLHDTAYAIAVDIAIADLQMEPEEARILQLLRQQLILDRDTVAVVERAAKLRHRSL